MLIELCDDLLNIVENIKDVNDLDAYNIDHIIDLMLSKKHIVYASRNLFQKICDCEFISQRNRQIISYILNHYVDLYSSLSDQINLNIVITASNVINYDSGHYYIPLSESNKIHTAVLSTETPTDFHFYETIFIFLKSTYFKESKLLFRFDNRPFGGGAAEQYLENIYKSNLVIFIISDSDKKYFNDKMGDTAKAVTKFTKYHCLSPIGCYVLNVGEKENLVPIDFYLAYNLSNQNLLKCINSFNNNIEFMSYVDIKGGIKTKQVDKHNEEWDNLYKPFIDECGKLGLTSVSNDKFISGIGNKAADAAIDAVLNKNSTQALNSTQKKQIDELKKDVFSHIPSYIMDEWKSLYLKTINFGCYIEIGHVSFIA